MPSSSSFVGFRLYAFVLGGWAKGYSVPLVDQSGNDRSEFGLIATVYYTDGTNQAFTAHFNPCVDIWQFTSTAIVARSAYSSIKVSMAYDYNCNTAWFDGIQLFKEQYGTSYTYDSNGNVTSVKDLRKQTTAYEYSNNNLTKATLPAGGKLTYTYDSYGRASRQVSRLGNTAVLTNVFTYRSPSSTATTGQIAGYSTTASGYSKSLSYTYDNNGNILTVSDGTNTTSYVYDKANQLLRENNQAAGKTRTYAYDNAGNILSKTEYAYTTGTLGTALSTKNYTYSD